MYLLVPLIFHFRFDSTIIQIMKCPLSFQIDPLQIIHLQRNATVSTRSILEHESATGGCTCRCSKMKSGANGVVHGVHSSLLLGAWIEDAQSEDESFELYCHLWRSVGVAIEAPMALLAEA